MKKIMKLLGCALFCALTIAAQPQLPEGRGKAEAEKLCKGCHEISRSVAPRQDRGGWYNTMSKMAAFGMKSTPAEFAAVLEYLSKNYPARDLLRITVTSARAIDLESVLSMRRSQARAFVEWREKNGPLKSLDELKKAPGMDPAKLDAKKDRIQFE